MVNRHEKILYKIDSRMYVFERTLQDIIYSISTMWYEIDLLDHIQIRLNRIHSYLFALQSNTDTIYEYLSSGLTYIKPNGYSSRNPELKWLTIQD